MNLTNYNYCLDTMGIQRWRSKDKISFETFTLLNIDDEQPQGILWVEPLSSSEAENLLDAMLKAVKLKRVPVQDQESLEKKLHIVMGEALARKVLSGSGLSFETLREGNVERIKTGERVLVTYHPGRLLLDQGLKRKAWEDLKLV